MNQLNTLLQPSISVDLMQKLCEYQEQQDLSFTALMEDAISVYLTMKGTGVEVHRDSPSSIGRCLGCSVLGPRERGLCMTCMADPSKSAMVQSNQSQ